MALDAMTRTRTETDSLGSMEIPADAYWGIHTARALENFPISKRPISVYRDLVEALAMVKQASARANREIGALSAEKADLIDRASQLVIDGEFHDQFVVGVIQGGAGTSTNMNANEVITNIALELAGPREGRLRVPLADRRHQPQPVDERRVPDGDQGRAEPRPAHAARRARPAAPRVPRQGGRVPRRPQGRPHAAAGCRADDPRAGVPRLRDDTRLRPPAAHRERLPAVRDQHGRHGDRHRHHDAPGLRRGRRAPPARDHRARPRDRDDLVESTSDTGSFMSFSSSLKRNAIKLSKICNDLRLLSSGPQAGIRRDQPARPAGGLQHHAGQGQPGHPRGRQPGRVRRRGRRPDGHDGGRGRPAAAQRLRARDRALDLPVDHLDAPGHAHAARQLRRRHHRQPRAARRDGRLLGRASSPR